MSTLVAEPKMVSFTAADRCDAKECGAQAHVLAEKGDLQLMFCGHHGDRYELGLLAGDWTVTSDMQDFAVADKQKG